MMILKCVIFKEDKAWDWNANHQEPLMVDLEWDVTGDTVPRNNNNVAESAPYEQSLESEAPDHNNVVESATNEQSQEHEESVPNDQIHTTDIAGRVRRQPNWMNDYVSHINFSEEEGQAHLVLFAELDPITYA
jgi:hypothetical protein